MSYDNAIEILFQNQYRYLGRRIVVGVKEEKILGLYVDVLDEQKEMEKIKTLLPEFKVYIGHGGRILIQ